MDAAMLGCYHIPEMSIKPGIEGASETHGRYPTPRTCISPPKTSIKSGIKNALGPDRPWLQVAGPKLTGVGLRLATVGAPQARSGAAADHLNRPSHQEGAA
jgi:hypothetical protein